MKIYFPFKQSHRLALPKNGCLYVEHTIQSRQSICLFDIKTLPYAAQMKGVHLRRVTHTTLVKNIEPLSQNNPKLHYRVYRGSGHWCVYGVDVPCDQ